MWTNDKAVFNKKPNFEKLIIYGFSKKENGYIFSADISDGMFLYNIYVTSNGETKLEVIDKATNEEYLLVATEGAVGSFVAGVKDECEDILTSIVDECFEPDLFKSEYSKLMTNYIRDKYKTDPEYLWKSTPNNCIFRHGKTKKWFVVFLLLEKKKLGLKGNGSVEIINLKDAPQNIEKLIDGEKYFPAFHMNKKHWYTLCLDGSIPIEEIYDRIDKSFEMIKNS